jgi:hypothetical protein
MRGAASGSRGPELESAGEIGRGGPAGNDAHDRGDAERRRQRRDGRKDDGADIVQMAENFVGHGLAEKAEKGKHGALHGIPASAPALLRATRAGEKAGAVGFDWPDADGPRAKVDEELAEFDQARAGGDREEMQRELGDVLRAGRRIRAARAKRAIASANSPAMKPAGGSPCAPAGERA